MKPKMKDRTEWLLERYLTLFPEPVEVTFPDGDVKHLGGWGGFSRTFFERGRGCYLACHGKCCEKYSAGWWFYLPSETPGPEPTEVEHIKLNGLPLVVRTHGNEREETEGCDYLDSEGRCTLYLDGGRLAIPCNYLPHVDAHRHGNEFFWSKRLPSRNWRWPKCMVDPGTVTPDPADDRYLFEVLVNALWQVPGFDERLTALPDQLEQLYDSKLYYSLSGGSQLLRFDSIALWLERRD